MRWITGRRVLFDIYRVHFIIGTDLEINGSFSELQLQPPYVRVSKALTLSSSPFWPFSTALFNAHKSHTDHHWKVRKGIDRDIWLPVDSMHNWMVGKQVISPVEVCDSKTLTLVLCAHCYERSLLFKELTLMIQSWWATWYMKLVWLPHFIFENQHFW